MSIKVSDQHSRLEDAAFRQRLQSLGLEVASDGSLGTQSKVEGGAQAVASAAGNDGLLDPKEAAQLERTVGFVGQMLGRNNTVSESASNSVRTLTMEVTALAAALRKADTLGDDAKKLMRRTGHFERSLRKATTATTIGKASPDVVHALADAVESLADASATMRRRLDHQQRRLGSMTVESNGGVIGALGKGLMLMAVAESVVQVKQSIGLLRPLSVLTHDLAAPASGGSPTEALMRSVAHKTFDDAGITRLAEVAERFEAKHTGLDRHDVAEALDGLFGKHYAKIGADDDAGQIARSHAELLCGSKDPRVKAAVAREDTNDLTVAEVFAQLIDVAGSKAKGDNKAFIDTLGVGYYRS